MGSDEARAVTDFVARIVGMDCWNVGAGGCTGSSFSLALGAKSRRREPIKNPSQTAEFRAFKGEASPLIWCTWRLDSAEGPIASSDEESDKIAQSLEVLVGQKVIAAETRPPAWDLSVTFTGGLILRVFCDHIPGDPSYDGNWQLRIGNRGLATGPGYKYEFYPDDP